MKNIIIPYTRDARLYAKELRSNPTITELKIWGQIRNRKLGVEFHRQVPMLQYVVDFYCHELMLAIEIDGLYHNQISQQFYDYDRQVKLEKKGVNFLRFNNDQIQNNMIDVIIEIKSKINELKEIVDN